MCNITWPCENVSNYKTCCKLQLQYIYIIKVSQCLVDLSMRPTAFETECNKLKKQTSSVWYIQDAKYFMQHATSVPYLSFLIMVDFYHGVAHRIGFTVAETFRGWFYLSTEGKEVHCSLLVTVARTYWWQGHLLTSTYAISYILLLNHIAWNNQNVVSCGFYDWLK